MRSVFFAIALLSLCACGHHIDPQLAPYVQTFEAAARDAGVDVSTNHLIVDFGEVSDDDSRLAVCQDGFLKTPHVVVRRDLWDQASETLRTVVVLHEMGHCLGGRRHEDAEIEIDGEVIPTSIMSSGGVPDGDFDRHRDHYLGELFAHWN